MLQFAFAGLPSIRAFRRPDRKIAIRSKSCQNTESTIVRIGMREDLKHKLEVYSIQKENQTLRALIDLFEKD